MYCPNCGHELKDDEKFCSNCGCQIEDGKVVYQRTTTSAEKEKNKEYGLISMICGILSLIIPYFNLPLAIVALVFSKKTDAEDGFSKTGRVTGIIGLIFSILSYLITIVYLILWALGLITVIGGVSGSIALLLLK